MRRCGGTAAGSPTPDIARYKAWGINARLIARPQQAIDRVIELAADAGERARLGAAAPRHAVSLNAEEFPRRTVALLANGGRAAERLPEGDPAIV